MSAKDEGPAYRILAYQAFQKLGYVKLDTDDPNGPSRFVTNWRHATAFPTPTAWDAYLAQRAKTAPQERNVLLNSAEPWSRRGLGARRFHA